MIEWELNPEAATERIEGRKIEGRKEGRKGGRKGGRKEGRHPESPETVNPSNWAIKAFKRQ